MQDSKEKKINAMAVIHELRTDIAEFIAEHSESVEQLIKSCDDNNWNDCVAYDFRDAMSKLGTVLASLMLWDRGVKLTKEERDAIEKQLEDRK